MAKSQIVYVKGKWHNVVTGYCQIFLCCPLHLIHFSHTVGRLMCKSHSGHSGRNESKVPTCDSHMTLLCSPSLSPSPLPPPPPKWSGTVNVWTPFKLQMVCSGVPEVEEKDITDYFLYATIYQINRFYWKEEGLNRNSGVFLKSLIAIAPLIIIYVSQFDIQCTCFLLLCNFS